MAKGHRALQCSYFALLLTLMSVVTSIEAEFGVGEGIARAQIPQLARMNEISVRRFARKTVAPQFPTTSLSKRVDGVAVTAIRIGPDGGVVTCRVLEAPDEEIAAATCTAAKQWTFRPVTIRRENAEHPIAVDTTLTFYFQLGSDGKGLVTEPAVPPKAAEGRNTAGQFRELQEADFEKRFAGKPAITLLDIRERGDFRNGHRAGAINIPAMEIAARVRELVSSNVVIVDCPESIQAICPTIARSISVGLPKAEIYVLRP